MAYLESAYAKRILVEKTIKEVDQNPLKDGITLRFTDGSYARIYNNVNLENDNWGGPKRTIIVESRIIFSAWDKKGVVIPAESFEEALDEIKS